MEEKSNIGFAKGLFIFACCFMLLLQVFMVGGMVYLAFELRMLTFELQELIIGIKRGNGEYVRDKSSDKSAPVELLKSYAIRSTKSKLLNKIQLPENPTEKQVEDFIDQIQRTTIGQRSFSSSDPHAAKLSEVGSKNVHLLISALGNRHADTSDYYLMSAIQNLANDSHKDLILKKLYNTKRLVKIVDVNDWGEDARDTLLKGFKFNSSYLPTEWIKVSAELEDKEFYPYFKKYLLKGCNKSWTYRYIKDLPGFDIKTAVDEVWSKVKTGPSYEYTSMAEIAVKYGHKDALTAMINGLTDSDNKWRRKNLKQALEMHLDFVGSDEELIAFYKKNKDKFVFDPKDQKYKVPKK